MGINIFSNIRMNLRGLGKDTKMLSRPAPVLKRKCPYFKVVRNSVREFPRRVLHLLLSGPTLLLLRNLLPKPLPLNLPSRTTGKPPASCLQVSHFILFVCTVHLFGFLRPILHGGSVSTFSESLPPSLFPTTPSTPGKMSLLEALPFPLFTTWLRAAITPLPGRKRVLNIVVPRNSVEGLPG